LISGIVCLSPLTFQMLTFEQKPGGSPLQAFIFLMNELQQLLQDCSRIPIPRGLCLGTEFEQAVVNSALGETHGIPW
jgi:hypothetical protein